MLGLTDVINLTAIYRTFHPNTKDYTFFSPAQGTFSKIDHVLQYKASLKTCKKIEVTHCMPSDHHGLKLNTNNNKNRMLTNSLLNEKWVKTEIKKFKTF